MTGWRWRNRAALLLASALLLVAAPSAVAQNGGDEEEPPSSTVAVPYLGEIVLPAGQGWVLVCENVPELPGITVECTPEGLRLAAPEYDASWGAHEVTLRFVHGARTLDAAYRIELAPPAPPALLSTVWRSPVDAGGTLFVPLSGLGLNCTVCDDAEVHMIASEPEGAAAIGSNGSHLVVRPRADATGMIVVTFAVVDDFGQPGIATLGVPVRPAAASDIRALHVGLSAPAAAPSTFDANALLWAFDPQLLVGTRIIACGTPLLGTVACDGTTILYTPREPTQAETAAAAAADPDADSPRVRVDQFSVRVVTASGRELDASMTLTLDPSAAEPSSPLLITTATHSTAALVLTPAPPPAEGDAAGGLLAPLSHMLDRLTAANPLGESR